MKPREFAERWKVRGRNEDVFSTFSLLCLLCSDEDYQDGRVAAALRHLLKDGVIEHAPGRSSLWFRWVKPTGACG